jgi:predicted esterase
MPASVPLRDVPVGARRLLVGLHGYDDDPTALMAQLRALDDAGTFGVIVPVAPTTTTSGGAAWFPSSPGDIGPPLVETLDALRASVVELRATSDEIVVVGYSQGAAVALALALGTTTGWRPNAVVALAAWLPNEPDLEWDFAGAARRGLRALLVHGTNDDVVPVEQGRSVRRLLERRGVDVGWNEIDAGHALGPLAEAARPWLGRPPAG